MKKQVLIVDDSATMRELISASIEDAFPHVDVHDSDNGFDALKKLPLDTFDLVITDINMPQMNGLELLQFIHGNPAYSHIPVVIITTEGQSRDRQKGMALGAREYIVKPFSPEQLVVAVRPWLEDE